MSECDLLTHILCNIFNLCHHCLFYFTLYFKAIIMSEIIKKAYFITCSTQIVIQLATMCIIQHRNGFKFNNNVAVTDKVGTIGLS